MRMSKSIIIASLLLLLSCNNEKTNSITEDVESTAKDTTIDLIVNTKRASYTINKELSRSISKFQEFLKTHQSIPELFIDTLSFDLDENKINDTIFSKIETLQGNCTIYSIVKINNIIALQDTLNPSDDLAFMGWSNDSIYYKLKPYTSFYEALLAIQRIEEVENGKINDDLISFFISSKKAEYSKLGLDSLKIKNKTDSIIKELHHYKGKLITTLEDWDRSLLFWNKHTKSFECLYTP